MLELLNLVVAMLQVEALDLATVLLQNTPGVTGWAPWRLVAGALLIITIVSGATLFTYWISKDE